MLIGKKTIGTIAYLGGIMALPEPFVSSFSQLIQFNHEYVTDDTTQIYYTKATVSYHAFARNSLVDQMRGEWLLQLDTDITFDPDLLLQMVIKMDKFDLDVLVAPYLYKSPPHPPVLYGYDPKTKAKTLMGDWNRDPKVDLIPIRSAGAGSLLVRKRVFDRIKKELKCSPFDIYFD